MYFHTLVLHYSILQASTYMRWDAIGSMSVGEGSSERDRNQTELRERSKHCTSPPEPQTKARDPAGCHRTTTIADYREKRNVI